jgi:uncharacterized protein YqeY
MRELGVIEQRIREESTAALKAGDKRRRDALSGLVAALKKERIDSRKEPTEADELTVLKREKKRRAEALDVYEGAGREDLAEQERYELQVLAEFMPEELGDEALEALVNEGIAATDAVTPKDMGKVMGWLKPRVAGRADGKKLSDLVREKLGG